MNLALFDFDGTITYGDTFTPFLRYALAPRRIAVGRIVPSPVAVGYKLGIVSPSQARARICVFGFRGAREADVRHVGLWYSRQVLPRTIRRRALETIAWHKAQGDTVVVVSASLDVYLTDWCDRAGVAVICTELEATMGTLTGHYRAGTAVARRRRSGSAPGTP